MELGSGFSTSPPEYGIGNGNYCAVFDIGMISTLVFTIHNDNMPNLVRSPRVFGAFPANTRNLENQRTHDSFMQRQCLSSQEILIIFRLVV